ncbi:Alpha/Beta hydrolase fold [Phytophthora cactorum]|nr:Alpha/Beta hydrolase fold [Phytophthora cactorum]
MYAPFAQQTIIANSVVALRYPCTSWSQRTLVTRLSDLIVEFARDWQLQHDLHPSFDMQLRSVIFLAAVIVQVSSGNKSTSKTSKLNGWYSCSEYTFSGTGSSDAQTAECATYSAPLCYPGVCEAPEWADQTVDIFVKRLRAADPKIATNVWLLQEGPGFASNDLESQMATLYRKLKGAANVYTMDHRGTGRSTFLDCSAAQAATSGSPAGNTIKPSEVPSCAKALERKYGDLASFSTTSAAKDLVTLVSEFSNGKNTIVYGVSYGSLLIRVYCWSHKKSVLHLSDFCGCVMDGLLPGMYVAMASLRRRSFS